MSVWLLPIMFLAIPAALYWWLPARVYWLLIAGFLILFQLFIWWLANQMDNGVPWNPDRPLITGPDPPWLRTVHFLLLYGPMGGVVAVIWKARR